VAADSTARETFALSAREFVDTHSMDGVDSKTALALYTLKPELRQAES